MKPLCLLLALLGPISKGEVLSPVAYQGWPESYVVTNSALTLVVVPAAGRLLALIPEGGENLLRFDPATAGVLREDAPLVDWVNHGGDWMWPCAQERWPQAGGRIWPPLHLLEGRPWQGEAAKDEDGTQRVWLRQHYGAPLHLEVERQFVLPPTGSVFRVEQSITRMEPSEIPVCLWQVAQMPGLNEATLAVPADSVHPKGYRHVAFDPPMEEVLRRSDEAVVFTAGIQAEVKIGTDGQWISGRKGEWVLRIEAEGARENGVFPDGGCSTVIYSNAGLGYTEIETLSVERALAPGESLQNVLHYRVLPAAARN